MNHPGVGESGETASGPHVLLILNNEYFLFFLGLGFKHVGAKPHVCPHPKNTSKQQYLLVTGHQRMDENTGYTQRF